LKALPPNPARAARNAAQRLHDILVGVEDVRTRLAELPALRDQIAALTRELEALRGQAIANEEAARTRFEAAHKETVDLLRLVHDDEPANRQRVWRMRETPEYALAFEEPEPLVSFAMATYTNLEMLMDRALPSILASTYERFEVVVVGDAASPATEKAVRGLKDPRIRYYNQTFRGPYDEAGDRTWYVAGGPPSNEAMRLARGRWILSMDDDDFSRPDRAELLLKAARERDLEFCYGQILERHPDGDDVLLCEWPPRMARVGLQASIMHAGWRFICAELGDALFTVPGDWSRIRRMMRLGVRMGMIDDVVVEYFPGTLWASG
jgi:hypothetical protein